MQKNTKKLCLATGHRWLESIDIDGRGNIYFSDSVEKALYRIKRNPDGTLSHGKEERLLWGFQHAGGVSIDQVNKDLYFGVRIKKKGKILKIPLELFDKEKGYQPDNFEKVLEKYPQKIIEFDIKPPKSYPSPKPNGLVYDPNANNVYFSHEGLISGKKAYVGSKNDPAKPGKFHSANGLDISTFNRESFLIIAQTLKNQIVRVNLSTKESTTIELQHEPKTKWGLFPDGVYCIENGDVGDVLFASFFYGRIYYMHWNGQSYDNPCIIAEDLDYPTDLVIGPSSEGKKEESMFITTTKWGWAFLRGEGNVIEVPNIQALINSTQK